MSFYPGTDDVSNFVFSNNRAVLLSLLATRNYDNYIEWNTLDGFSMISNGSLGQFYVIDHHVTR